MRDAVNDKRLLIVGCGYVGQRVVELARRSGYAVYALTRASERHSELRELGVVPIQGHWMAAESLSDLPMVDHVLVSVPHREDGRLGSATHVRGLENLLAKLPTGWDRLIYLSTTGVYGKSQSEAVDEHTPISPTRIGPEMAVAAENWLTAHLASQTFAVLRLAGIYGPGRIPLADQMRAGEPLAQLRDGHLNLVHVADIARAILAMFGQPLRHSLYLLSDGQPVMRETFYRYVARLCGVADPVFVAPDEASPKVRRSTDKRIDPSLIVRELGFAFQFPDYRSGLAEALGGECETD